MNRSKSSKISLLICSIFYLIDGLILIGPFVYGWAEWTYISHSRIILGLTLCLLPTVFIVIFMFDAYIRMNNIVDKGL